MHGQYHDLLRLFEYGGFPPVPRHFFFSSPYVYHRLSIGGFTMFCIFLFPKQFTVGVLSSFLRGVRPCVTGRVRLSGSVALFVSLHLSPFMCLPEWWCPPLRSCLCLVSLHLSPFMCLPEWWCPPLRSCLCLVSLHVSP